MSNVKIAFKIIIGVLLALAVIWSAFWGVAMMFGGRFMELTTGEIQVAGVSVRKSNAKDILGDGTVYYDAQNNILTFNNASIESDDWTVYSKTDLNIQLIGENKFVCNNKEYSAGVYMGDYYLSKDLALIGDGSLKIELPNKSGEAVGIFASELTVATDVSVITSDCENKANGIVCASSLIIADKGTVSVNNGAAAKYSSAVRVRGNTFLEEGTKLKVTVNNGSSEICKGLSVSGDLFLGKDTSLEVLVDDAATYSGECIRVSGLMEISNGSTVTASAKNTYAIECLGSIEANKGADVSAVSDKKDSDIFCSGAVINYGAEFDAEIDALGGIHNRAES